MKKLLVLGLLSILWTTLAEAGPTKYSPLADTTLLGRKTVIDTMAVAAAWDSGFAIMHKGAESKRVRFDANGVSAGVTRTISFLNADGTMAYTSTIGDSTAVLRAIVRDTLDHLYVDSTLVFPVFSTAPSVAVAKRGAVYIDSDDDKLYRQTVTAWGEIGAAPWKLTASDGSPDSALYADASGYIHMPLQPCFSAIPSAISCASGDNTAYTVKWSTETFDVASNLSNTTFTAPVTGKYLFTVTLTLTPLAAGHTSYAAVLTTTLRTYTRYGNPYANVDANGYGVFTYSVIADMDANDTCTLVLYVGGGAKTVGININGTTNHRSGWYGQLIQ